MSMVRRSPPCSSLVSRPVSREQLAAARGGVPESLFHLEWTPVAVASSAPPAAGWVVLGAEERGLAGALGLAGVEGGSFTDLGSLGEAIDAGAAAPGIVLVDCALGSRRGLDGGGAGGDIGYGWAEALDSAVDGVAGAVRGGVGWVLELVQAWLADERLSASRLILVTQGAMVVDPGDGAPDLVGASVWGLMRSAQSENPGRFVLVDLDREQASLDKLGAALAADEPQLAVREGGVLAARLSRGGSGRALAVPAGDGAWRLDAAGQARSRIFRWSLLLRRWRRSSRGRFVSRCAPRVLISVMS